MASRMAKAGGRVKKSAPNPDASVATMEDDGTQVDNVVKKKKGAAGGTKSAGQRRKAGPADAKISANKDAFAHFVTHTCKTGIQGLLAEFDDIKRTTQAIGATPKIAFDAHADRNRYKDVYCIDESRVVLKWPEGALDYIHANWAPIDDKRKYICTQGPIVSTIDDFWRMVWQEKCLSIVMLCNIVEQGKKKCEQYFPETGEAQYGSVNVKVKDKQEYCKLITISTLVLSDGKETRDCDHYHWNNWPDRGVPLDVTTCMRLLTRLKKQSPTVIHCSAGIGRTGTIVGLDMMMCKIMAGEKTTLKEVVIELRAKRHGSVQMDIQYLYMHRVLLADAVSKKVVTDAEVADFVTQYETLCKQRGFM